MVKRKKSGITLFAALATGLSSSCSIVAIGNKANIDKTKDEGKIRSVSSEVKAGSADIAKLLAFGIGSTALTTGTVLVINDKFNKNSEINTVNQLSSKIKEQENAINRLTQTSRENLSPGEINYENKIRELEEVIAQLTLAAKAKINELENVKHSGEQANKQGTNPFAIVMYVTGSLAMITFLSSLLLILYKLKNAGVFEAINLVGPIIRLIKETFEIKKDLSLEGLKKKLVTVKEILENPQKYVCKEIKELYSKLNGIELKNIVSLEEFKIEYESLLGSNDGYTYKEASTSKAVSKSLDKIKKKFNLDTVLANKVSKPKTDISDKFNEVPGSRGLIRKNIAYKAVLKCLKKKKNKLENENKKKLKEIEKIKKEKSEQEFNNSAIRKANLLKLEENKKEFNEFHNEIVKLKGKVTEATKKYKGSDKNDNKAKEEYNKFMEEFKPKLAIIKHLIKEEDGKQVLKEVEKEVDTKKYETKISKLDKEIEENYKKILKIDILNSKLKGKELAIIDIISVEKTPDSIFNKINNYIKKETADDNFDEIVKLVNDYANALKEGNLINLISEQKVGKEKLKETIIPALKLVKNVAILLNEKRKNLNKNEIVDIEHQNTNLEVIIKNVTNLLAAAENTMKELDNKNISYTNILGSSDKKDLADVLNMLKNNYNEINNM